MTTARTVRQAGLLAALVTAGASGCVERKFVVESNVPNAQVYIDDRYVGAAPAYSTFDYYGYYTITVVHPGYQTIVRREHAVAPWYAYPPFDLLADIAPFPIRDTRRVFVELAEAPPVRPDDIISKADELRARGMALPPAETPALPRTKAPAPPKPPGPIIQPPIAPDPIPGPAPLPGPAPAPGVVPSVMPSAGYTPPLNASYVK
jgi:hypothetical protein